MATPLLPGTTIRGFEDEYKLEKIIGRGGFAHVFLAKRVSDNKIVAVKSIFKRLDYGQKELDTMMALSREAHSEFITQLLDGVATKNSVFLVMPYYKDGSLRDYVKSKHTLRNDQLAYVINQVTGGLRFLHEKGIAHRDVTPANVLIKRITHESLLQVVLSDFGLAKCAKFESVGTTVGTTGYMAPQVASNKPYNCQVDLYSFGATIFFLSIGRDPTNNESVASLVEEVQNKSSKALGDLIYALMSVPAKISLADIRDCAFVAAADNAGSAIISRLSARRRSGHDCAHRFVNENGCCSRCEIQVQNPAVKVDSVGLKKDRRPRSESQDPQRREPLRQLENRHDYYDTLKDERRKVVPENSPPEWPLKVPKYMAPINYISAKRGRFMLRDDYLMVYEKYTNQIPTYIVEVYIKTSRNQTITVFNVHPDNQRHMFPKETDDPLKYGSTIEVINSARELSSSNYAADYKAIMTAIELMAARRERLAYVNYRGIRHLEVKFMFNNDFRCIINGGKSLLVKHGQNPDNPKVVSTDPWYPTPEQLSLCREAYRDVKQLYNVFEKSEGHEFIPKTITVKRNDCTQQADTIFSAASFPASVPGTTASAPQLRRSSSRRSIT